MGTQQILLIVLSVIIVGAAIAVGIQMFNSQAYSANKTAIAADAQSYASQIVQYYKTPESQGGLGGDMYVGGDGITTGATGTLVTAEKIANFIGWGSTTEGETTTANTMKNDNGEFEISSVTTNPVETVVIKGTGKEEQGGKNPVITTTITFPAGTITAVATDEDVATEED